MTIKPSAQFQYPGQGNLVSLAFSPDGKRLASAVGRGSTFGGGAITIWDLEKAIARMVLCRDDEYYTVVEASKECVVAQRTHASPMALEFSPDGKWLIVGDGQILTSGNNEFSPGYHEYFGLGGSVRILNANTLEEVRSIRVRGSAYGIAVSHDGTMLAAIGSDDRRIWVGWWDLKSGKERAMLAVSGTPATGSLARRIGSKPLRQILFSHDDRKILAATVQAVQLIDVEKAAAQSTWSMREYEPLWLDLSKDDSQLYAGSGWRVVGDWSDIERAMVWNLLPFHYLNDSKHGLTVTLGKGSAEAPCPSPVVMIEIPEGTHSAYFIGPICGGCAFAVSDDECWTAVGDPTGRICVWKVPTAKGER